MTPRRAFWEAASIVCIPTVAIWSVLLYLFRAKMGTEWPILLFFVALPLPLIYPLYNRYLLGTSGTKQRTPASHFVMAALSAALGSDYVIHTLLHHKDRVDLATRLVMGLAWLIIGIDHVRRAVKARKGSSGTAVTI
jgi:hypothetical protein